MSKLLRSMTSSSDESSGRYPGGSMDVSVKRASRRIGSGTGYGRIGTDGSYEAASPSFSFRVSRRLRIPKLGSSMRARSGKAPSSTFLGRLRVAYERFMLKAGSPTGELNVIPVAKSERAPPAVTAAVSTWIVSGSRKGAKVRDLDPGFKLTAAEKKYLQHLTRTASVR